MLRAFLAASAALTLLAAPALAADPITATARLATPDGGEAGTVQLTTLPTGTLVQADLRGLPAGPHAFHVHETGSCEGDFKSAGGHFAPEDNAHGFRNAGGPHTGDFPNIHVPEGGTLTVEYFNDRLVLAERLFDDDGAAIVIHQKADDYDSQPAGDAGDRIACGVIEKTGG